MRCEGVVLRTAVAAGSKSGREAVVLRTDAGDFVLRLAGGPAFADPRLDALVGKRIRAEGDVSAGTLIVHAWDEM
ncbi:MAG: hypothetical protein U1F48_06900 [Burkholderiales bacterium]